MQARIERTETESYLILNPETVQESEAMREVIRHQPLRLQEVTGRTGGTWTFKFKMGARPMPEVRTELSSEEEHA